MTACFLSVMIAFTRAPSQHGTGKEEPTWRRRHRSRPHPKLYPRGSEPPQPTPREAPRTVPLKDITITLTPVGCDEPTTVSGEVVGEILEYVARARPNVPHFLDPDHVGGDLESVAEICQVLSVLYAATDTLAKMARAATPEGAAS